MATLKKVEKEYDVFDFYKMLQSPWQNLYIDIRETNLFNRSHPRFSINIPVGMSKAKITQILKQDIEAQQNIIANLYIYTNTINANVEDHIYSVLSTILKTNFLLFPEIMVFNDKNHSFENKYPFLCIKNDEKKESELSQENEQKSVQNKHTSMRVRKYLQHKQKQKKKGYLTLVKERMGSHFEYPDQILNDRLFLGDINAASNKEVLRNLEITHIVNCTRIQNEFEECKDLNIKYFQIPITDIEQALIGLYFNEVIGFIATAINENEKHKVFVHCHRGVSRSSTIVIAYLMKAHSMTMKEGLKYVETKRNIIEPNEGFKIQLKYFEDNGYKIDNDSLESDLKTSEQ